MAAVSGYTLDMYCDTAFEDFQEEMKVHEYGEFPHEFIHPERGAPCRAQARRAGWVFHKDLTTTCPKCNRRKKTNDQRP